jgi:chromosome segregation ATPase
MNIHRSPNDLGRIAANEIAGIEPRGSIELIIATARGDKAPSDADASASALLRLAEALQSPPLVRKQISDLSAAAADSKAAAEQVRVERRKLEIAKQDLDAEHAAHVAKIEREVKEHEAAIAAAHAELESVQKQAADLKARAEQDAAKAAALRAEVERKYKAFAA